MRDSRISSRLFLLVACFISLFSVFAFMSFRTMTELSVNGPTYKEIALNDELRADILPPPMYVIEAYLLSLQLQNAIGDGAAVAGLIQHGDELRISFETRHEYWERELNDPQIDDMFNKTAYRTAIEFFNLRDQQFIPAIRAGNKDGAQAVLAQMASRYEAHRVAIDVVVGAAEERNKKLLAGAEQSIDSALRTLLIIGLFTTLVVLIMAYMARSAALTLSERVDAASEIAVRVASGDLTVEPPTVTDADETGKLLRAIGTMTHSLRSLVTRVKQASIELMSTATEFAATSRQQESTVQGFSASTNEIAAAAKQISATSQELMSTMEGVNTVAAQTADLAEQGRVGLRSLDDTMDRLARTSSAMSARLAAIREEASEINGVVTTISKVADQTNFWCWRAKFAGLLIKPLLQP
jgi:methyl-accepting chemotaxis protein